MQAYFDESDDCQWLKETHLRGIAGLPDFKSFSLDGSESSPMKVELFEARAAHYQARRIVVSFASNPPNVSDWHYPVPGIPHNGEVWQDGSGHVCLEITADEANSGYHSGSCDDSVMSLSQTEGIRAQLDRLDPATVRHALKDYGSWDAAELEDHPQNLQRLLWLACGDIVDNA